MPCNQSASVFPIRASAGSYNSVTYYGVILHEEKLIRSEPRIISPRSVTQILSRITYPTVINIKRLRIALGMNNAVIHNTKTPPVGVDASIIGMVKMNMINPHCVIRRAAGAY